MLFAVVNSIFVKCEHLNSIPFVLVTLYHPQFPQGKGLEIHNTSRHFQTAIKSFTKKGLTTKIAEVEKLDQMC